MLKIFFATMMIFVLGMLPRGGGTGFESWGGSLFVSNAEAAPSSKLRKRFSKSKSKRTKAARKRSGKWYSWKNLKHRFLNPQWTHHYANRWGYYDTNPVPFRGIYERQYRKYYVNR